MSKIHKGEHFNKFSAPQYRKFTRARPPPPPPPPTHTHTHTHKFVFVFPSFLKHLCVNGWYSYLYHFLQECQALECSNTELQFKVRTLERERDELRRLWNAHVQRHRCVASVAVKPRLAFPASMETNSANTTNITESVPAVLTQACRVDQSQHTVNPVTRTSQDMRAIVVTSSASITSMDSIGVVGTATLGVSAENVPLSPIWHTDSTQNSPQYAGDKTRWNTGLTLLWYVLDFVT